MFPIISANVFPFRLCHTPSFRFLWKQSAALLVNSVSGNECLSSRRRDSKAFGQLSAAAPLLRHIISLFRRCRRSLSSSGVSHRSLPPVLSLFSNAGIWVMGGGCRWPSRSTTGEECLMSSASLSCCRDGRSFSRQRNHFSFTKFISEPRLAR